MPEQTGRVGDQIADAPANGNDEPTREIAEPITVFEGLREQYEAAQEERRITIPIAPGRYGGNLSARYAPGPWSDYRKRAERMFRKGGGEETELQFAAATIVKCCETILFRPTDGTELIPMHEANPKWRGGEPVRYDARLAAAVGLDPIPESASAIARLVFGPGALNDHFVTLDAWLKEAIASDDEDEDDEGAGRVPPT